MNTIFAVECYRRLFGYAFYPHVCIVKKQFVDALGEANNFSDHYAEDGWQKEVVYEKYVGQLPNVRATIVYSYTKFGFIEERVRLTTRIVS